MRFWDVKWLMTAAGVLVFLAVLAAWPSTGRAMCVYNDTSYWQDVYFKCGIFCENQWSNLQAHNHACRPGKGGTLTAWFSTADPNVKCTVKVDKHGWVTLKEKGMGAITQYKTTSYHSNGSVKQTCYADDTGAARQGAVGKASSK